LLGACQLGAGRKKWAEKDRQFVEHRSEGEKRMWAVNALDAASTTNDPRADQSHSSCRDGGPIQRLSLSHNSPRKHAFTNARNFPLVRNRIAVTSG